MPDFVTFFFFFLISYHPERIHIRSSSTGPLSVKQSPPNAYFPPDPHNDPFTPPRLSPIRSSKRPQVSLQMIHAPIPPPPFLRNSIVLPCHLGGGLPAHSAAAVATAQSNYRAFPGLRFPISRLAARATTSSFVNRLKQDRFPYTLPVTDTRLYNHFSKHLCIYIIVDYSRQHLAIRQCEIE